MPLKNNVTEQYLFHYGFRFISVKQIAINTIQIIRTKISHLKMLICLLMKAILLH